MVFTFNLNKYTDRFIPGSIVNKLPDPIGRFVGKPHALTTRPKPDYILWLDVLIGTFCGLLTIEGVFKHSKVFKEHNAPILIASYGATSILLFNVNQVPLAQPRNILFGQFLSALVGVIILKLFELSQTGKDHLYIGAALSTGIASIVMSIFNCVHPPSGATALIPLIDPEIAKMGWWYLPAHLVSSVLIIGVGLITNNVIRSYPVFWWTAYKKPLDEEAKMEKHISNIESDSTVSPNSDEDAIIINRDTIYIPSSIVVSDIELQVLNSLKLKLHHD